MLLPLGPHFYSAHNCCEHGHTTGPGTVRTTQAFTVYGETTCMWWTQVVVCFLMDCIAFLGIVFLFYQFYPNQSNYISLHTQNCWIYISVRHVIITLDLMQEPLIKQIRDTHEWLRRNCGIRFLILSIFSWVRHSCMSHAGLQICCLSSQRQKNKQKNPTNWLNNCDSFIWIQRCVLTTMALLWC